MKYNQSKIENSLTLKGINLQLFAEPGEGGDQGDNPNPNGDEGSEGNKGEPEPQKTYTQEEINEMMSKRLNKERAKWEKDYQEKLQREKAEAEKLASLSAEERAKAEFEKEQQKFEEDRRAFEQEKLSLEVRKQLADEGLNQEFATFLIGADADSSFKNISTFKEAFEKAVEADVIKKLADNTPKVGGSAIDSNSIGARLAKNKEVTKQAAEKNPYF